MSQQSINTNPDLSNLLLFQDTFISLIHTQLFHKPPPFQEALLTFEIHHISDINQKYNSMMKTLSHQLIDKKINYQLSLRDCFQRLLQSDFLPLLRINRYELTKLSLFGFDIYVDPLQAVLQILSRLDVVKSKIIESTITLGDINSVDKALEKGWDSYMCFVDEWKLSLNIYMLQEYLRVGGKSFLKKDREILFTGISNLYAQLVTSLTKKNIKLLKQLAELNNSLYQFHPSFNYFQFYTLLPVQIHLEPIFSYMVEIAEKCIRTNILTPLLFGILRHREAFLKFIQNADSPIWLPYLNALISGIAINLKFRILQYEQIIEIFEKAACRAGLLGTIRTDEIFGTVEIDWRDARQFFISAVKIGFNSGDVQIWKTVQFETIGVRIIGSIINGMLLNPTENPLLKQYLQNGQEKLKTEIQKLNENKIDGNVIKNSLFSLDKTIKTEQQLFTLIRIINLTDFLQNSNEYRLHFIISSILKIQFEMSSTLNLSVHKCIQKINSLLYSLQNITLLKDIIINLHQKYPPNNHFEQLISFYFRHYQPKRSLSTLLKILSMQSQPSSSLFIQMASKHFIQKDSTKFIKIRTFERQLLVKSEYVNAAYQANCVLNALVSELLRTKNPILIQKLILINPWIAFSLLNFPVNEKQKVYSLVSYLLQNTEYHNILQFILSNSQQSVYSEQGCDLIMLLSYPNLCEQLSKKINQLQTVQQLLPYCHLLVWILSRMKDENLLSKDLLTLYLYLLEHNEQQEFIQFIINDITILANITFKDKLEIWLASLISKKIQGKIDVQRNTNKRMLKCPKNGIYFINQISNEDQLKKSLELKEPLPSKKKIKQQLIQGQDSMFWFILNRLNRLGLDEINSIFAKESLILLQQFKNFFVPEISKVLIPLLLTNQQEPNRFKILNFISLNSQNYSKIIEKAIQQKNGKYLSQNRYTFILNGKLKQLLSLQIELKTNFLKEMSTNLSQSQKQKIASKFFLQKAILPQYIQNIEGIQYFVIYNHSNWRIIIEHITQQFIHFNLASILLQYRQYLNIISQTNQQYQQTINSQGQLFHRYVTLFSLKFSSIFTQSTSQQQIQLKTANELSSLNMVISSLQLKEIAVKLGQLHQFMKKKNIQYNNCSWSKDLIRLNQIINTHVQGDVVAPDFLHGYSLTNENVFRNHKSEVGLILELYFYYLGEKCPLNLVYQPSSLKKQPLSHFQRNSVINTQTNLLQSELKKIYEQIISYLVQKEYSTKNDDKWQLNYSKLIEEQQVLVKLYKLGSIVSLLQSKEKIYVPSYLRQLNKREKLDWETLKEINCDLYQEIHSLLVDQEIGNRNIFFITDNKEFIPEGKQIKVNQYNRQNYCQKLILHKLGPNILKCTEEFFKGYINQKANV